MAEVILPKGFEVVSGGGAQTGASTKPRDVLLPAGFEVISPAQAQSFLGQNQSKDVIGLDLRDRSEGDVPIPTGVSDNERLGFMSVPPTIEKALQELNTVPVLGLDTAAFERGYSDSAFADNVSAMVRGSGNFLADLVTGNVRDVDYYDEAKKTSDKVTGYFKERSPTSYASGQVARAFTPIAGVSLANTANGRIMQTIAEGGIGAATAFTEALGEADEFWNTDTWKRAAGLSALGFMEGAAVKFGADELEAFLKAIPVKEREKARAYLGQYLNKTRDQIIDTIKGDQPQQSIWGDMADWFKNRDTPAAPTDRSSEFIKYSEEVAQGIRPSIGGDAGITADRIRKDFRTPQREEPTFIRNVDGEVVETIPGDLQPSELVQTYRQATQRLEDRLRPESNADYRTTAQEELDFIRQQEAVSREIKDRAQRSTQATLSNKPIATSADTPDTTVGDFYRRVDRDLFPDRRNLSPNASDNRLAERLYYPTRENMEGTTLGRVMEYVDNANPSGGSVVDDLAKELQTYRKRVLEGKTNIGYSNKISLMGRTLDRFFKTNRKVKTALLKELDKLGTLNAEELEKLSKEGFRGLQTEQAARVMEAIGLGAINLQSDIITKAADEPPRRQVIIPQGYEIVR